MSEPTGILVFGLNGSGKTTLGRELARILNYKHMDHEDYHFIQSEIPYTAERSWEDCLNLMLADIEMHGCFVLSAVTGDFGEEIPRFYRLGVFMTAPLDLRMERLERRAYERHGERVREGGDMVERQRHRDFMDFAASRPLSRIERWAETLSCPVVRVDGAEDWRANAARLARLVTEDLRP